MRLLDREKGDTQEKVIQAALAQAQRRLIALNHEEVFRLDTPALLDHQTHEATLLCIQMIHMVREGIAKLQLSSSPPSAPAVIDQIQEFSAAVTQMLAVQSRCPHYAGMCQTLTALLFLLFGIKKRIAFYLPQPETPVVQTVLVPSDVLYEAYANLFPVERMLLIAGRQWQAGVLQLGATFDVTGTSPETHEGYVKADPLKLVRAFEAMDFTGTELGAWMHSHPGNGSDCTRPSKIDTHQHQDWLRTHPANLLSIIMVEDGYFRVFGTAIETGQITLALHGKGIKKEDDFVYRLTQEAT